MNVIPSRQRAERKAALESWGQAKETGNKIYHRRCLASISQRVRLALRIQKSLHSEPWEPLPGRDLRKPSRLDIINI